MPANHFRQQMAKKRAAQQARNSAKAKKDPNAQQLLREKEERERLKAAKKSEEERIRSFGFKAVPKTSPSNSSNATSSSNSNVLNGNNSQLEERVDKMEEERECTDDENAESGMEEQQHQEKKTFDKKEEKEKKKKGTEKEKKAQKTKNEEQLNHSGKQRKLNDSGSAETAPRLNNNNNMKANSSSSSLPLPTFLGHHHQHHHHLKVDAESQVTEVSGLRGIVNLGNTCFINAALQALAHITPLRMYFIRTYFRRLRVSADVSADALFDAFIKAMWSSSTTSSTEEGSGNRRKGATSRNSCDSTSTDTVSTVVAKGLVTFTWRRFPWLHPGEQHDAQEFLRLFLNELHDALKTVDMRSVMMSFSDDGDDHHPLHHQSSKSQRRKDVQGKSPRAADRAQLKELAEELLALASYEEVVSRQGRLYRAKLDAFIRLTTRLAEAPSDDEGEGEDENPTSGLPLLESSSSHHDKSLSADNDESSGDCCCNTRPHGASSSSSCSHSPSPSNSCSSPSPSSSSSPPNSPRLSKRDKSSRGGDDKPKKKSSSQASHGGGHQNPSPSKPCPTTTTTAANSTIDSRSIISDIFTGQLENTVRCTVCGQVSVTVEPFQDLSIPISVIDRAMKGSGGGGVNGANHRLKPGGSSQTSTATSSVNRTTSSTTSTSTTSTLSSLFSSLYTASSSLLFGPANTTSGPHFALFQHYTDYLLGWLQWLGRLFLPPTVQLADCLDVFFNPEALEKENRYSCDRCRRLTNGTKAVRIRKLPEVLTIHLNRYQVIGGGGGGSGVHSGVGRGGGVSGLAKITTHLAFPLVDFDVGRYLAVDELQEEMSTEESTESTERSRNSRKSSEVIPTTAPAPSATYELVAVVCHQGAQLTAGHYTAYALNDLNFEWYEYDDVTVRHVPAEEVVGAAASHAYILFYQRMSASPLASAASYPSFETYAEDVRSATAASSSAASGTASDTSGTSAALAGSSSLVLSKSQAAMNLCTDLEQLWLERYWSFEEGSSSNPFADYYFFSQNMSSLVACFNSQNNKSGSSGSSTFFSNSLNSSYGNFTEATLNEKSVTISRYWLNLFLTVADPGPIDNGELFCRHRRIRPTEWMFFNSLAVPLIEPVGRLLLALYGGGPTMSRLKMMVNPGSENCHHNRESLALEDSPICVACSTRLNELRERRRAEWSRWAMLQQVPGMVFKRLKLRKADAAINFEMLDEEEEREVEEKEEVVEDEDQEEVLMTNSNDDDNDVIADDLQEESFFSEEKENDQENDEEKIEEAVEVVRRGKEEEEEVPDDHHQSNSSSSNNNQQQLVISTRKDNGEVVVIGEAGNNIYGEYNEEEEDEEEEPTLYYLISAEWIQAWFNFVNVDWGADLTSARNRQLMAIYQKITAQDTSATSAQVSNFAQHYSSNSNQNSGPSNLRQNLNHVDPMKAEQYHPSMSSNPNHQHHLPHPPFSSLIRAVGTGNFSTGNGIPSSSTSTSNSSKQQDAASASARTLLEQQLWSQLDVHHHTVLPPGPIDNWSLFGLKRKLLAELKKLRQQQQQQQASSKPEETSTFSYSEPTTYNELVALLARCLCRSDTDDNDDHDKNSEEGSSYQSGDRKQYHYRFTFSPRLHGGFSEEQRSCAFYLISPEYWQLFSTAYGGGGSGNGSCGPVFTFDYRDVEQKFSVQISVADVEHFIRHHFKGGSLQFGSGNSQQSTSSLLLLDQHYLLFSSQMMILDNGSTSQKQQQQQSTSNSRKRNSTSTVVCGDNNTSTTTSNGNDSSAQQQLRQRRRTVSATVL